MTAVVRPRRRQVDPATRIDAAAAGVGALALSWLLYERLLPFSGPIGFWIFTYVVFLVLFAAVSRANTDSLVTRDRVAAAVFASAGIAVVALLTLVISFTVTRGFAAVRHLNFFRETNARVAPDAPLTEGGVYAAIVGTLEQVMIATSIAVPLGLVAAVYLNEVRGRLARFVRTVVETMTAIPTILAGLFVFAAIVLTLGFNRSGLAVAIALGVNMLPVVTSIGEVMLRLVPGGLREAAQALGASHWVTVRRVVLPTARPGLVTAVLLGVARVIGETAPVLICAGFTNELNYNPVSGPQVSLPLFTFTYVRFPLDLAITRAFGSATILLVLVVTLFSIARIIGGKPVGATREPRFRFRRSSTPPLTAEVAS